MRIGVSIASAQFVDDHAEGARNILERARAARDAGLDSLSLGDQATVHDLYYRHAPDAVAGSRRHYYRWFVPATVRRARRVMVLHIKEESM